jgi:hypothetical protein
MNTNKEKWQAFAEEMREAVADSDKRHAVAKKIVKYVSDSIEQRDVASLLLPKEFIPVGTTAEYAVPGQLKAYWHEPGSYAPRTSMIQKVFTVPTWMISAHPEYEISQLEAGRYGSVQDQVKAAREAILGAVNARVFNTLRGSVATTDSNYMSSSTNRLNQAALDHAINWVEDQVGGVQAIVGRRNVLFNMLNFGTTTTELFSDSMKDKAFNSKNAFPTYRGVPVIGLPNWRDGFGKQTIPQGTVMVIGKDAGRYVVNQELRSKDDIDVDTLIWHIHLYMKMGCAVWFPERLYRIELTN